MPFTYGVDMNLPQTPDVEEAVVAHFSNLGFRLIDQDDGEWTFHRGHILAFLYRFDIRTYATTLRVRLSPLPEGDIRVRCDYEILTFLAIPMSEDIARLESEVAQFVSTCLPIVKDPHDHMSASRLPGQLLLLWALLLLTLLAAVLVGSVVGVFLGLANL